MQEKLRFGLGFLIILTSLTIITWYSPEFHVSHYISERIRPYIEERFDLKIRQVYPSFDPFDNGKLLQHPFYKRFHFVKRNIKKSKVTLLLIVSSAPNRYDRRMNIRKTWWKDCHSNYERSVECIFMTDNITKRHELYDVIMKERIQFNDMRLQNLEGGVVFGHRMIYHMVYAMLNYDFEYFLRMDDDYFLCVDKLIYELPKTPVEKFHWGWVHRHEAKNTRRPEESMIMLSRDVISKFLSQNESLLYCHPWADQMIIVWSHNLGLNNIYRHDERLHHDPIYSKTPHLKYDKHICENYIGIHGVYPDDMLHLWNNRGDKKYDNKTLLDHSVSVYIPYGFCWSCFNEEWRYEPKLCIENYQWNTSHQGKGVYGGRETAQ